MSNQELCTQYQLILRLLKKGDTAAVIEILENAVNRIDKGAATGEKQPDNE